MSTYPTNFIAPLPQARHPEDLATLVFASVIAESMRASRQPLIRGLSESCFQKLLKAYFSDFSEMSGLACSNGEAGQSTEFDQFDEFDEFDEILELLLEHRASMVEQNTWLAHAIASAAMGDKHLWQDMGLPSRQVLSELMQTHFPSLAAKNSGDMKWKKFFYRQLCERAGIPICKSPRCADCCDYRVCFGPEC